MHVDSSILKELLKEKLKLGKRHRRVLYVVTALLWLTGCAWLVLHYYLPKDSPFGPAKNPFEPLMLKLHGLGAMAFLVMIGTLFAHIRRGLGAKLNRPSGVLMIAILTFLTLTGWLLYYGADEGWRYNASTLHSIVGALIPLILVIHITLGRRSRGR